MTASDNETALNVIGPPGPTSNSKLRIERESARDPARLIPTPQQLGEGPLSVSSGPHSPD